MNKSQCFVIVFFASVYAVTAPVACGGSESDGLFGKGATGDDDDSSGAYSPSFTSASSASNGAQSTGSATTASGVTSATGTGGAGTTATGTGGAVTSATGTGGAVTTATSTSVSSSSVSATSVSASTGMGMDSGAPTKRVFVTSAVFSSNLGGLAGADTKCQQAADAAALGGTYKAWLSDESTSVASRMTHAAIPYALVDGTIVASDWSELTSNFLAHAIDRTEKNGAPLVVAASCGTWAAVWTGSQANGDQDVGYTCSGWSGAQPSDNGDVGDASQTSSWWTDKCSMQTCGHTAALYCMEQ